jgi:glucose-6-phosphate isomerase
MFHFTTTVNLTLEYKTEYERLSLYTKSIQSLIQSNSFDFDEASLLLPIRNEILSEISQKLSSIDNTKLQYIFLVGIGGSNLGTKAVYNSLWGVGKYKTILFLDTINQQQSELVDHIIEHDLTSSQEYCVITVSKSGTTYETTFLSTVLNQKLTKKFNHENASRQIIITDKDSKLWKKGQLEDSLCFSIPEKVGGRFSVLSTVGLVPLFLSGINCEQLLKGGEEYVTNTITETADNASADQAVELLHMLKNGATIHNLFIFSSKLEQLGAWYRQLLSESIGKKYNIDNKLVSTGIVPMVSIGTTDLHSQAQLYFNGNTKQIFTTFLSTDISPKDISVSDKMSDAQLLKTIYTSVKNTYNSNELKFNEIILESVDEYHLGLYFVQAELMIMYLAKLLNINAFDQPQIELYKEEVRKLI